MSTENAADQSELGNGKSRTGSIVPWACPDCSGSLWEEKVGSLLRFECRVGHAYSPESLLEGHAATVERTMWAAIRLLEEGAVATDYLSDQLGGDAKTRGTCIRLPAAIAYTRLHCER
ncbi:MAG TPA: hypothetical protein VF614_03385 [Chthoniobacteraceae bacterium]|jgi:two-component system chemotaxis response regulator CheB